MTIETLREQMITAMKVGNKFTKEVLSFVLSTAKNMAIEKGCKDNISEEIVNAAISKRTVQQWHIRKFYGLWKRFYKAKNIMKIFKCNQKE